MATENKFNFNFLSFARLALVLSLAAILYSGFLWFQLGDSKYGVDYKGGHEILVKVPGATTGDLRKAIDTKELKSAVVQEFESGSSEFAIRLAGEFANSTELKDKITASLVAANLKPEILSTNFIGPTVGEELRRSALIAIIVGLIGILAYITYRFEFAFALGAVAALFHDVIICLGIYLLFGKTLNMSTLAAALTIVGYSVNDTIIIFDRIREEMGLRKEFVLEDIINFSINATLSRTIITSVLTLFTAVAILLYGGGAIRDLALFLTIGVIAGTYSTIFIASPVAMYWERYKRNKVQ